MNAPIVRLYVGVLLLFALLVGFTSNWTVFDADELEAKTANKRPLLEARQIERGKIFSSDGELIAESLPEGQDESLAVRAALSGGRAVRQPDRLQLLHRGLLGLRARRGEHPGRQRERVRLAPRPDPGAPAGGLRHRHDARRRRAAAGDGPARPGPEPRVGGRDRAGNGRGQGDGVIAGLRPEHGPPGPRAAQQGQRCAAARSPRSVDLRAGIDDEGRDRRRGARLRRVHARHGAQRRLAAGVQRRRPRELGRDELRRDRHARRARPTPSTPTGRRSARRSGPRRCSSTWSGSASSRTPRCSSPTIRRRPSGVYSGGELVDSGFDIARVAIGQGGEEGALLATADADGRGRGDRGQRRHADAPDARPGGQRPRRPRDRGARPRGAERGDQRGVRSAARRNDDHRRRGGHRLRALGRGQHRSPARPAPRRSTSRRASTGPGSSASRRPTIRRSPSR